MRGSELQSGENHVSAVEKAGEITSAHRDVNGSFTTFGDQSNRQAAVRACALSMAGAIAAIALSGNPVLTAAALLLAGAMWTMTLTLFNIGVQLSTPRWVADRSLAAYQAASSGGIAIGSWR